MKKLILPILIIHFFILQSCQNEAKKIQPKDTWDFTRKAFEAKNIRLLGGYDVFDFTKNSDSTIILKGEIFRGWKNKPSEITDTLRLTEKYFVKDSLGNSTKQILSYAEQNQTYFQLIITKKRISSFAGSAKPKTNFWFNYEGKLFINKKSFQYFNDFLYTK